MISLNVIVSCVTGSAAEDLRALKEQETVNVATKRAGNVNEELLWNDFLTNLAGKKRGWREGERNLGKQRLQI